MPDWDSNTYRYCVVLVPPEQQTLLRFHRKHSTCLVSPNIFTSGVYSTRNVAHKRKQKVCIKRPSDGVRVSSFWVITARFFSIRETVVAVRNETKPPSSPRIPYANFTPHFFRIWSSHPALLRRVPIDLISFSRPLWHDASKRHRYQLL